MQKLIHRPRMLLGVFAFIASLMICSFSYFTIDSHRLSVERAVELPKKSLIRKYHDFNRNDYSELMLLEMWPDKNMSSLKLISYSGGVINQSNFPGKINSEWLILGDYTGDRFDDIFLFQQENDSLFLYGIDPLSDKLFLDRQFVLEAPRLNEGGVWDVERVQGFFLEEVNEKNQIVFFVTTAHAIYPRTIFVYDLDQRIIRASFPTDASLSSILLFDLNRDGKREIIVTANASNNVGFSDRYGDDRCWIFILDQDLKPVCEPVSVGSPPSSLSPIQINSRNELFLPLLYRYTGIENDKSSILLLDSSGRIETEKEFDGIRLADAILTPSGQGFLATCKLPNKELIQLTQSLEIERRIQLEHVSSGGLYSKDLDADYSPEILSVEGNQLRILNKDLKTITKFTTGTDIFSSFVTFKCNGPNQPIEVALLSPGYFHSLRLIRNPIIQFLPLIFVSGVVGLYLCLLMTFKLGTRFLVYTNQFTRFVQSSAKGVIITDAEANILLANGKASDYLNSDAPFTRSQNLYQALAYQPKLRKMIKECLSSSVSITRDITIPANSHHIKRKITSRPLKFGFLGFSYANIIEIMNENDPLVSDSILNWSKSLQRIAHEIKNPLTSIVLNLHSLNAGLSKEKLENEKEIRDNITDIREELDRIRGLTQRSLQFLNADRPVLQVLCLPDLLGKVIESYERRFSSELKIRTELHKESKEINADTHLIETLFHILIENAIDAMEAKGDIVICSYPILKLESSDPCQVEMEVSDNGPGISEEDLSRIFDLHFSTRKYGTGLGLPIAKRIVEAHGGEIRVSSRKNIGTSVSFTLRSVKE